MHGESKSCSPPSSKTRGAYFVLDLSSNLPTFLRSSWTTHHRCSTTVILSSSLARPSTLHLIPNGLGAPSSWPPLREYKGLSSSLTVRSFPSFRLTFLYRSHHCSTPQTNSAASPSNSFTVCCGTSLVGTLLAAPREAVGRRVSIIY